MTNLEATQSRIDDLRRQRDDLAVQMAHVQQEIRNITGGLLNTEQAQEILWDRGYNYSRQDINLLVRTGVLKGVVVAQRKYTTLEWLDEHFPRKADETPPSG